MGGTTLALLMMAIPGKISPPPPTECETRSQEAGAQVATMWQNAGASVEIANRMANKAAKDTLRQCEEEQRTETD